MGNKVALPGGELEFAVLAALWKLGSGSARDIHARVGEPNGLVYTTVAKVLDRLRAKALVRRERRGRGYLYRPTMARETIERARAERTVGGMLGSEPRPAIAALVEAVESIDPALLDELARIVAARRRARR